MPFGHMLLRHACLPISPLAHDLLKGTMRHLRLTLLLTAADAFAASVTRPQKTLFIMSHNLILRPELLSCSSNSGLWLSAHPAVDCAYDGVFFGSGLDKDLNNLLPMLLDTIVARVQNSRYPKE